MIFSSSAQSSARTIKTLIVVSLAFSAVGAAAAPQSAQAGMLVGAESNGELVNSNLTPEKQAATLDRMKAQGVQVVRANFGWNEVAPSCAGQSATALSDPNNPCYNWLLLDSLVSKVQERNMQLLLSTSRAPVWLHGSTDVMYMGKTLAQVNRSAEHYAAFLAALGRRYGAKSEIGTVRYWTVWNEPNGDVFWHPRPNADHYARVYARAAKALKAAHPTAQISPGPTAPSGGKRGIKPVSFIKAFQRSIVKYMGLASARKHISAWAHNPYPGKEAPHIATGGNSQVIGMAGIEKLFRLLDASPVTRGKSVWATEFGYQTGRHRFDRGVTVSMANQARYLAESYHYLAAKKRVTIGVWYGFTDPMDPVDWQSGTLTTAGTIKPSYRMFQRMVSIPQPAGGYRKGKVVQVWGRANTNPARGLLMMRKGVRGRWALVPRQRRTADGSIVAAVRLTSPTIQFTVFDGRYGMTRTIKSR